MYFGKFRLYVYTIFDNFEKVPVPTGTGMGLTE